MGKSAGIIFYANPDRYPPTVNAATLFSETYDVTVLCRNVDDRSYDWPGGITVRRTGIRASTEDRMREPWPSKAREYWRFIASIRSYIAEQNPAFLYAYDPHAYTAALLARRDPALPVIFHRHEVEKVDALPWRSLQTWIFRYALQHVGDAAFLVFPEPNRAQFYLAQSKQLVPVVIVPNFPRAAQFPSFEIDGCLQARWESRELLYRGMLGGANGNIEHVRALAHLPSPAHLRLVGSGDADFLRVLRKAAREEGVEDRVAFEGFVHYARANALSRQATIGLALYHARDENYQFSVTATNKLYEYAACGLPVIVSDIPAYRTYLGKESWVRFADPASPASIAAAVADVLDDRERYRAMCHAAREAFETRFHYERVFQPVLDRIRELLERKGGGSTPSPRSKSA